LGAKGPIMFKLKKGFFRLKEGGGSSKKKRGNEGASGEERTLKKEKENKQGSKEECSLGNEQSRPTEGGIRLEGGEKEEKNA